MTTANLENCKKLYELSGWGNVGGEQDNPDYYWVQSLDGGRENYTCYGGGSIPSDGGIYPAYDLGYLLRKLEDAEHQGEAIQLNYCHHQDGSRNYCISIGKALKSLFEYADTPEDAACLLAIKLIEQGVLKK